MYNYITKSFSEKFDWLLGKTTLMCLLIFCLNFVLKTIYITATPLSGDEPFSVYMSQMRVGVIWEYLFTGNNPPLYEIILHYWVNCFGVGEFSVRIFSVIISSLTGVFIYKIGFRFFNKQVALTASILFLFSNYHTFFSHEARCYTMLGLFTAASFYFFLHIIMGKPKKVTMACYILVNTLILYLHYFGAWVLFSQAIASVLVHFIYKRKIRAIIVSNFMVCLFYAPVLYILFQKISLDKNWDYSWLGKVTGLEPLYDMIWAFSNVPVSAVFCLVVLAISVFLLASKKIKASIPGVIILSWFFIIYILMFVVSFRIPMFHNRYVMPAAIAFPILMAYGAFIVSQLKYIKYVYIVMLCLFIVTSNFNPQPNLQTEQMVNLVKQNKNDEKCIVFFQPQWNLLGFCYYYDRELFKRVDEKSLYKNIETALSNKQIYGVNTTDEKVFLQLENYNKIIFIDTDHGTCFPGNHIQNLLGAKYQMVSHNPDTLGFGYYIYLKPTNGPQ
ncbi:MAG: glycosyltransferase family 39 protein [Bacteroidota bacterium]|nr:glycosyltransferase family 39 protein [Bacteroidota bacterium]